MFLFLIYVKLKKVRNKLKNSNYFSKAQVDLLADAKNNKKYLHLKTKF